METKPEPKAGDPCPQCGGAFVEHRAPTAEERAAADNHEIRTTLPARVDSAPEAFRAEFGALHECAQCGYQTRIKPAPKRTRAAQAE